ncbi:MAG: ExeM/NucH family extracellular endonuclease, partial [Pseudanabaenaceae cyanobacterium]
NGGSTDPAATDNSGWNITTFPAQSTNPKTAGVQFSVPTTGFQNISVSFDQRHSNTAANTVVFQYSTDGSNFIDFATFTATSGDTWFNSRTANLTAIPAVNNNSNFAFRIVSDFAPSTTSYAPSNSTSTYGTGGTWRFDMVTVSGNPSSTITPIGTIQGTGLAATAGTFTVQGMVIGDFQDSNGINGFFIQDTGYVGSTGDSDPNTSDGILVLSNTPVNYGDIVTVTGTVQENNSSPSFNQAVIRNVTTLNIESSGNTLPSPVIINNLGSDTPANVLERYEGMLVHLAQPLTVIEHFQLGRFGQVQLSSNGIQVQPTETIDPNDVVASGLTTSGNTNVAAINAARTNSLNNRIFLDDASNVSFPHTVFGPGVAGTPFINPNSPNTIRIGSTINDLTGVLGFAFNNYRIYRNPYDSADALNVQFPLNINYAPRPTTVPTVGNGNVRVAAFNVLNYFTTLNVPAATTGPNNNLAPRGANTVAEFERQAAKTVAALTQLNADVVGLIEMENNGVTALQDLVNRLNAATAPGTYAFIADPPNYTTVPGGTDAIKVGFIYKPAVVTPLGTAMAPNDTRFNTGRAPVAQTFLANSNGAIFTPVINHFKSKGSATGLFGAPTDSDQGDGQGASNATRRQQALALLDFVNTQVLPMSGDNDVLLMGDFNAYSEEDPIDILRAGGFTRLSPTGDPSFVFDGFVGNLDHALVNSSLLGQVTGAAKWNINAFEPTALDYNNDVVDPGENTSNPPRNNPALFQPNPFRSSDHDPILVGLNLTNSSNTNTLPGLRQQTFNGSIVLGSNSADQLIGTTGGDTIAAFAGNDLVFGLEGNDSIDGGLGDDTLNGGPGNDTLIGSVGNDLLTGGPGADVFLVRTTGSFDIITDFEDGIDRIRTSPATTFNTLVGANFLNASQSGADTLLSVNGVPIARLSNFSASNFTGADLI